MRDPDEIDVECIRGWLNSPSEDTGVYLASDEGDRGGSWDFLPYTTMAQHVRRVAHLLVERGSARGTPWAC